MTGIPLLRAERTRFHQALLDGPLTVDNKGIPSIADSGSESSCRIAKRLVEQLGNPRSAKKTAGQKAGALFEQECAGFLGRTFLRIVHLKPGRWEVRQLTSRGRDVLASFDQYAHIKELLDLCDETPEIASLLGSDYVIAPDVVVIRYPLSDGEINASGPVVDGNVATLTPLRERSSGRPILHASISCKWTMRSDRAQNARAEALNLARMRKGRTPHIVIVTAEPTPGRLASLASGTGDIDCVYHFALHELQVAVEDEGTEKSRRILGDLVRGRRLRDIADLPLDLAI